MNVCTRRDSLDNKMLNIIFCSEFPVVYLSKVTCSLTNARLLLFWLLLIVVLSACCAAGRGGKISPILYQEFWQIFEMWKYFKYIWFTCIFYESVSYWKCEFWKASTFFIEISHLSMNCRNIETHQSLPQERRTIHWVLYSVLIWINFALGLDYKWPKIWNQTFHSIIIIGNKKIQILWIRIWIVPLYCK